MLGGGNARRFATELEANIAELETDVPRFTSYVAPGSMHVITNRPEMYTMRVGEVAFTDWLAALVGGGPAPESVSCEPNCLGPLWGDLGAPEEWACLDGAIMMLPPPRRPTADAVLRIVGPPRTVDPAHDLEPLPGLTVQACGGEDVMCAVPLDETVTTTTGEATLTVPTGTGGFDGYFYVTGEDAAPTRLYFWPPLAEPGLWPYNGQSIVVDTMRSMPGFVRLSGDTWDPLTGEMHPAMWDPRTGQVRVSMLDCAGSYTARADSTLDGEPPDAYISEPPPQFLGDRQATTSVYVNVAPGHHTVRHIPDVTGEPATALRIFTFESTVTEVWGFGPRP
jgi:hypothetical protein